MSGYELYCRSGLVSAGPAVASRLSENNRARVLVLEAGGTQIGPNVENPSPLVHAAGFGYSTGATPPFRSPA